MNEEKTIDELLAMSLDEILASCPMDAEMQRKCEEAAKRLPPDFKFEPLNREFTIDEIRRMIAEDDELLGIEK